MAVSISRVQFLRGDVRGERAPVRPPWALPEAVFADLCSRCGDCIEACPEHLLTFGRGGFPIVDFARGECSFCEACARACRDSALLREGMSPPWSVRASITERCLAHAGVVCATCAEHCELNAIRFIPEVGSVSQPSLDPNLCTGCGACYAACPVQGIAMRYLNQEPAS